MWQTKVFKTKEKMEFWLKKHQNKIEYKEIFVNNAFGVDWRRLKVI